MQQIYGRALMPKCDWVSSYKFAAYFQNNFS